MPVLRDGPSRAVAPEVSEHISRMTPIQTETQTPKDSQRLPMKLSSFTPSFLENGLLVGAAIAGSLIALAAFAERANAQAADYLNRTVKPVGIQNSELIQQGRLTGTVAEINCENYDGNRFEVLDCNAPSSELQRSRPSTANSSAEPSPGLIRWHPAQPQITLPDTQISDEAQPYQRDDRGELRFYL